MDEFVYNAIEHYKAVLRATGRCAHGDVEKLLALVFFRRLLNEDYRGYVTAGDYATVGKALECLYGGTCLIPYADYLKMGKLKMGDMAELLSRAAALERDNAELRRRLAVGEALMEDSVRRIDGIRATPDEAASAVVVKNKNYLMAIPDIDVSGIDLIEGK